MLKSKQFLGVFSNFDRRIVFVLLILFIVTMVIFLPKLNNYVDCEEIDFYVMTDTYNVGEVVEFHNETPNAKELIWDFGDGSSKEFGKQVLHKYDSIGIYTIKLFVNGFCEKEKQIEIKDLGKIVDRAKLPVILAPEYITVGDTIKFKYHYYKDNVFSWEWSFGESSKIDRVNKFPRYEYQTPGKKIIVLILNGDSEHKASKIIYVKPRNIYKKEENLIEGYVYEKAVSDFEKPIGNPQRDQIHDLVSPIPIKAKTGGTNYVVADISENQFELMILQLANQSKEKEEFARYMCDNLEIPVVVNNNKIISFLEFCKKIKEKEIKIQSLRLTKSNLNCIDGFSISYKIKRYLIWVED